MCTALHVRTFFYCQDPGSEHNVRQFFSLHFIRNLYVEITKPVRFFLWCLCVMCVFSALMVVPGASEKAGLGCIPGASEIGGTGACGQNIKA